MNGVVAVKPSQHKGYSKFVQIATVQKEAFPLAGGLTIVNVQTLAHNLTKPDTQRHKAAFYMCDYPLCKSLAAHQSPEFIGDCHSAKFSAQNLSKPDIGKGAGGSAEDLSVITTRGADGFKDTLGGSFATSTREEFLESIKKGSTTNAAPNFNSGEYQPFGSIPSFRSLSRQESFTHELKLPCPATALICSSNESSKRMCFIVLPLRSNAFFPFSSCIGSYQYYNGNTNGNYHSVVKQYSSFKTMMPRSGGTLAGHLTTTDSTSIEVAVMDIITPLNGRSAHTQDSERHPVFIWLIAAVRRDCPSIVAVIHHIPAESEQAARRTLAKEHVCFFAGRLNAPRQEVRHA